MKSNINLTRCLGKGNVQYLPPATKLGQGNIFSSVCQEFCTQGGLPYCMLGYHPSKDQIPPGTRHPPGPDTPRPDTAPGTRHPPGPDTPPPRRYGQQAGGTHPTGMQSCFIKVIIHIACFH